VAAFGRIVRGGKRAVHRRAGFLCGTGCAITSLDVRNTAPTQLAEWIRGQWHIEVLHHICTGGYGEDASHIRTGSGPQVMAALRNLAIGVLKLSSARNVAAARRHLRDAARVPATLGPGPQ
jgi:hypothetical protein